MHMCVHVQEGQKSGSSIVPQKTYTVFLKTESFTGPGTCCQLGWVARENPLAPLQYRFVNMCCLAWLFVEVLEIEVRSSFLGGK